MMTRPDRTDPAPYALPPGTPALESSPLSSRRAFLVGAASSGLLGLLFGSRLLPAFSTGAAEAVPAQQSTGAGDRLAWARQIARGELAILLASWPTYLSVLSRYGSREPELWAGWRRIASAVLAKEEFVRRERCVSTLIRLIEDAPADVRAVVELEVRALRRLQ